jgi:hypothetical protein
MFVATMATRIAGSRSQGARCTSAARFMGIAAVAFVLLPPYPLAALADGTFSSPCGDANFVGPDSPTLSCNVGGGTTQNAIGKGSGVAGLDNFDNHLSPIHYYGTTDAFAPGPRDFVVTTNPTWDVLTTGTYLRLDGIVTLQGPSSSVEITLRGHLGGPDLVIAPPKFGPLPADWTGGSVEFPLGFEKFGTQFTANAVETLTITIVGRARYDVDGSPEFLGANGIPEPATGGLFFVALIGSWMRRQRATRIAYT